MDKGVLGQVNQLAMQHRQAMELKGLTRRHNLDMVSNNKLMAMIQLVTLVFNNLIIFNI